MPLTVEDGSRPDALQDPARKYSVKTSAEKKRLGLFSAGHGAGSPLWLNPKHGGQRAIWRERGKYVAAGACRFPRGEWAAAGRSNRSTSAGSLLSHPA